MSQTYKAGVSVAQIHLDNIMAAMDGMSFSKDDAARIVGGKGRLMYLIAMGEIDFSHSGKGKNSKWKCNAVQVLKHCRMKKG